MDEMMNLIFDGGSLDGVPIDIGDADYDSELNITICRIEIVLDNNGNQIMKRTLENRSEVYRIDEDHRALFKTAHQNPVDKNWALINHE